MTQQEKYKRRRAAREQVVRDMMETGEWDDWDPTKENTLNKRTKQYSRKMLEHRKEQDRISWRAIWAVILALGAHAYLLYLILF